MSKVRKLFSINQGRNIWRILLTDLGQIVLEERDVQKKEVFFSCIDRISGDFYWKDKKFLDELFWIGIEGTISKYLILHQFEKPDMPNHKKIITVDLNTGEIIWINDELTFYDLDEQYIYGYKTKFNDREFLQLSIDTGEIKNNLGNELEAQTILNSIKERDYSRYSFSQTIGDPSTQGYQKSIINRIIGDNIYFNFCEYIDANDHLIFSYYDRIQPGSLVNRLVVYDKSEEKILLTETLNNSTPAPVPDSFFMFDNVLYFIKNKTELVAYSLSS